MGKSSSGLESQFPFGLSPFLHCGLSDGPFSSREKTARGPLLREGWLEVPLLWAQRSRRRPHDPLVASLLTHVLPSPSQLPSARRNFPALVYPNLLFTVG